MSDLTRDRVQAILTPCPACGGSGYATTMDGIEIGTCQNCDGYGSDRKVSDDIPWLARRLLEALDTIDKARELHQYEQKWGGVCGECESRWPCPTWQALNGGNVSGEGSQQ